MRRSLLAFAFILAVPIAAQARHIDSFKTPFYEAFELNGQVYPQPPNVGLLAARPTFCSATGQLYYATDNTNLYYSTVAGTSCTWATITGGGGSAAFSALTPGVNTTSGTYAFGAGTIFSLAAASGYNLPVLGGCNANATINLGLDTTDDDISGYNGMTCLEMLGISGLPGAAGNIATFGLNGSSVTIVDGGAPLGGGASFVKATIGSQLGGDYLCWVAGVLSECIPSFVMNPQTGSSYAILSTDRGASITAFNAGAQAYSIRGPSIAGFTSSMYTSLWNRSTNAAGIVTLTPADGAKCNGGSGNASAATTCTENPGDLGILTTDNTDYFLSAFVSPFSTDTFLNKTYVTNGTGNAFTWALPGTVTGMTSGGVLYGSSTTAVTSSGILNTNVLVKGGGAGSAPTNSSITDNGTTATSTDTGGYVAPVFTANGTTAGYFQCTQGTDNGVGAANTIRDECPTSVTTYETIKPSAAASGLLFWTNASSTVTESILIPVSGAIPYGTSTSAMAFSALLTTNDLVKGGGAGGAPTSSAVLDDGTYLQYGGAGNNVTFTADWTCGTGGTVSSCAAATILGSTVTPMTFTLPSVALSWTLTCDGVVGQATGATANQWNLITATHGATNVTANYMMDTTATGFAGGAVTDQGSTTTTFQIAPSWTLGATATKMPFHIWARIEGASVSGTVLSLQLLAPTVADLVTIYRGTTCRVSAGW